MKKSNKFTEYLDNVVREKGSFTISWDGGNDDGSYEIYEGEESIDYYGSVERKSTLREIVERFHSNLGYGSFAGNYYCSGSATYNPDTKCIEGTDTYEEEEDFMMNIPKNPIRVEVPQDLWFFSLDIVIEYDNFSTATFRIEGPVHEMHGNVEEIIKKHINKETESKIRGKDVSTAYREYTFRYEDFKLDKKKKVRYVLINEIPVRQDISTNNNICVDYSNL